MYKKLTLLFFLFSFFFTAKGQQFKGFSNEGAYLSELDDFFSTKKEKEIRKLLENFTIQWNSNGFFQSYKQNIVDMSNVLHKKHMQPYPDFTDFLSLLISFSKSENGTENFREWEHGFNQVIETSGSNLSRMRNFMESTARVLNDSVLYQTSSAIWKVNYKGITFDFHDFAKTLMIRFNSLDLICLSKRDTFTIFQTQGTFYPDRKSWQGKYGKINWERLKLDPSEVYAELSDYKIDLTKPEFTADTATFYNRMYLQSSQVGRVEDRILTSANKNNATYPRFYSYSKRVQINNIIEDVDYNGGFVFQGTKLFGQGSEKQYAIVTVKRKGQPFVTALSKAFIFEKMTVFSEESTISMRFGKDSISHPNSYFKIIHVKGMELVAKDPNNPNGEKVLKPSGVEYNEVVITRTTNALGDIPFFNNYHKLDMDVPEMSWYIGTNEVRFKISTGGALKECKFESADFFSDYKYDRLKGLDKTHPLILVRDYQRKVMAEKHKMTFYIDSGFVRYVGVERYQVHQLLLKLSYEGFINYNLVNGEVAVNQRLSDYLSSKVRKKDFDVISLTSKRKTTNELNAKLDLESMELQLFGVEDIIFSDIQRVSAIPDSGRLIIKKNRNIVFNGVLRAGLADFLGKKFNFNYDSFYIKTDNIDKMQLLVRSDTLNNDSAFDAIKIRSTIRDLKNGLLRIDAFNNKSSQRYKYMQYPIFSTKDSCYVYYHDINKSYTPDKFNFRVYPFTLDSLNEISQRGIQIRGKFNPGDIFKPFEETLIVQRDSFLGFVHKVDPKGIELFNREGLPKGKFNNVIKLDGKGLTGNGKISYLTSVTESKNFDFYPDSLKCKGTRFVVTKVSSIVKGKEDTTIQEYPSVSATITQVTWRAYKDQMQVKNDSAAILLFDNKANLNGTLFLTPKGITADGKILYEDGIFNSKKFAMREHELTSLFTDFLIKSYGKSDIPFKAFGFFSHLNLVRNEGIFKKRKSDTDTSILVQFPVNKYVSYTDHFLWDVKKRTIDIGLNIGAKVQSISMISDDMKETNYIETDTMKLYQLAKDIRKELATINYNVMDTNSYDTNQDDSTEKIVIKKNKINEKTNLSLLKNDALKKIDEYYRLRSRIMGGRSKIRYLSKVREQEGLDFWSTSSHFDIETMELVLKGVDSVHIADMIIQPSSNIFILPKGTIWPLNHALLMNDTVGNQYKNHKFNDATVTIFGKNKYQASGQYYYSLGDADENYSIKFNDIHFQKDTAFGEDGMSLGIGAISPKDSFHLSRRFIYHGKVNMQMSDSIFMFDGKTKPIHTCENLPTGEMRMKGQIDPKNVMIPFYWKYKKQTERIYAGNFLTPDSAHVYSVFMKNMKGTKDKVVFTAVEREDSIAYLRFNEYSKSFLATSMARHFATDTLPNYPLVNAYQLDIENCAIIEDGRIEYGNELALVEMKNYATLVHNTTTDNITLQALTAIKLPLFSKAALNIFASRILANTDLSEIDYNNQRTRANVARFVNHAFADSVFVRYDELGSPMDSLRGRNNYTMVFSDLRFRWDVKYHCYISTDSIGIASIGSQLINKYVPGKIRLLQSKSKNEINMYFKINDKDWFYFIYQAPTLRVASSVSEFIAAIDELKDDERAINGGDKERGFAYYTTEARNSKNAFLTQIEDFENPQKYIAENEKILSQNQKKKVKKKVIIKKDDEE